MFQYLQLCPKRTRYGCWCVLLFTIMLCLVVDYMKQKTSWVTIPRRYNLPFGWCVCEIYLGYQHAEATLNVGLCS